MDPNAYKMIRELHDLITHDERKVLTTNDIAYMTGILKTMLTLYHDDSLVNQPSEARRVPIRSSKPHWWSKLKI